MLTRQHHIITFSRFKTHWAFRPGSPTTTPDHIVPGLSITYELTFAPKITDEQKADAIRFFEQSVYNQDKQALRARFVGLFMRYPGALAWEAAA